MSTRKINAAGLACPKPVIMTKKEIESLSVEEKLSTLIEVIVDNETAQKNLFKLAESLGYDSKISKKENGLIYINMAFKDSGLDLSSNLNESSEINNSDVYLFSSESFGENIELGKTLIKSLIFTISETKPYPKTMIFLNSGVKITTSEIPGLDKLEETGVKIISCGACLNYFKLENNLKYGQVSNMYEIYSEIQSAARLVKLS